MTTLRIGWAVHGKVPGAPDEYHVLACSEWPLPAVGFESVIRPFLPREPPRDQSGPDAFPWTVFTTPKIGEAKQGFRGMAVTNWSGGVDSNNRPILETRYCCVPADHPPAVGFSALHESFDRLERLASGALPGTGPIEVDVADLDATHAAARVTEAGLERASEAAAALLDRRTVVILAGGGTADVAQRLRFLDAVAVLLPAGAPWLTAATWWDQQSANTPAGRGRVHLSFSARAHQDAYVVGQGREHSLGPEAANYRAELLRLVERFGLAAVIGQLAKSPDLRRPEPAEAVLQLTDLDLAGIFTRRVRQGLANLGQMVRLLGSGRADEVPQDVKDEALARVAPTATVQELAQIASFWHRGNERLLLRVARSHLWDEGWPAADFAPLQDIARRIATEDWFFAELTRQPTNFAPQAAATAQELIARIGPDHVGSEVRQRLREDPMLALLLAMGTEDVEQSARWLEAADWRRRGDGGAARLALVAMAYAVGLTDSVAPAEVNSVWLCRGETGLIAWYSLVRHRIPGHAAVILNNAILPGLCERADRLKEGEIQKWHELLLGRPRSANPDTEAARDLLFCRWGRPPEDLLDTFWRPERGLWQEYADSLTGQLAQLGRPQHDAAVGVWAHGLGRGWGRPESRCVAVLSVLWTMAHQGRSGTDDLSDDVLPVVVDELSQFPGWVRVRAFEPWVAKIRRARPALIFEAEIVDLPPDVSGDQLAERLLLPLLTTFNNGPERAVAALRKNGSISPLVSAHACEWLAAYLNRDPAPTAQVTRFTRLWLRATDDAKRPEYRWAVLSLAGQRATASVVLLTAAADDLGRVTDNQAHALLTSIDKVIRDLNGLLSALKQAYGRKGSRFLPSWLPGGGDTTIKSPPRHDH